MYVGQRAGKYDIEHVGRPWSMTVDHEECMQTMQLQVDHGARR